MGQQRAEARILLHQAGQQKDGHRLGRVGAGADRPGQGRQRQVAGYVARPGRQFIVPPGGGVGRGQARGQEAAHLVAGVGQEGQPPAQIVQRLTAQPGHVLDVT